MYNKHLFNKWIIVNILHLRNVRGRALGRWLSSNFFLLRTEGWLEGLVHARQALYQRATPQPPPSLFYVLFWDKVSCETSPGKTWTNISCQVGKNNRPKSWHHQSPTWQTNEFTRVTYRNMGEGSLTGAGQLKSNHITKSLSQHMTAWRLELSAGPVSSWTGWKVSPLHHPLLFMWPWGMRG